MKKRVSTRSQPEGRGPAQTWGFSFQTPQRLRNLTEQTPSVLSQRIQHAGLIDQRWARCFDWQPTVEGACFLSTSQSTMKACYVTYETDRLPLVWRTVYTTGLIFHFIQQRYIFNANTMRCSTK